MLEGLIALLGTSSIGAIIGGVLGIMNKRLDIKVEMEKLKHQALLRDKDLELAKVEAAGALAIREEETEGDRLDAIGQVHVSDVVNADLLNASKSGRKWYVAVDVLRRAIRPVATVILLWAAFATVYAVFGEEDLDLTREAFLWVTGQASAVLSFWFLSRTSK